MNQILILICGHYIFSNNKFLKLKTRYENIDTNIKDSLFLFCAGPFGNILAHQLFESNPNNIYMDIGSTLNPWLQSEGFKRDYYINGYFAGRSKDDE